LTLDDLVATKSFDVGQFGGHHVSNQKNNLILIFVFAWKPNTWWPLSGFYPRL
jgi:hypothetical protein